MAEPTAVPPVPPPPEPGLIDRALDRPWLTASLALVLSWLLIGPWGNYALNDDWTYAHLAKHIAETNTVKIDVPIAPNAVGQAVIGALVVKVFGFSHGALRFLTLALTVLGLFAIDTVLALAVQKKAFRLGALLLFAFNPIVYYSAASFMNELWGWVPPLLGATLWLWDRHRTDRAGTGKVFTWWVPAAAGAIIGFGFWTRQFGVLLFPALLGATAGQLALSRRWKDFGPALLRVVPGMVTFGLALWSYFPWARATGNLQHEFETRVNNLTRLDGTIWLMQSGSALVYLTVFFLPMLVLHRWKAQRRWAIDLGAAAVLLWALAARAKFQLTAPSDFWIGPIWSHKVFPWVVNIIWNAGLGPITLDDGFFYDAPKPTWPRGTWVALEVVFVFATILWVPVVAGWFRRLRANPKLAFEVPLFGALWAMGCLVAIIQSHQNEMVDRYYLPLIFGFTIALPVLLEQGWAAAEPDVDTSPYRLRIAGVLFAALALFSVLGSHDQFQWNDARWALHARALTLGGTRANVQGGYEVNCWWKHEGLTAEELSCPGGCRCVYTGFCCVDDTWRLGMSLSPGYSQVEAIQPHYWLANGPPLILSRRP